MREDIQIKLIECTVASHKAHMQMELCKKNGDKKGYIDALNKFNKQMEIINNLKEFIKNENDEEIHIKLK